MSISSFVFLLFFAVIAVLYYTLPSRFQRILLLVAGVVFFLWPLVKLESRSWAAAWPVLLCFAVLVFAAAFSYFLARAISRAEKPKKTALAAAGIILLVALLLFYKYGVGLVNRTWQTTAGGEAEGVFEQVLFPLGLSFYSFQIIGYWIDLKNEKTEFERSFLNHALFISFFPQIMSGPIGRAGELFPQYRSAHAFSYTNVSIGLQRFLWGAYKKIVVADLLAILVKNIHQHLHEYQGLILMALPFIYLLQLYFDFSGYSDMAVGAARVLDIRLRENFKVPLLATNVTDLWNRWHMSLTSWLRDYIYIPLGGSKKGTARKLLNILIVFTVSGLWHGDTWGFLIWGILFGLFRCVDEFLAKRRAKKLKPDSGVLIWVKRLGLFAICSMIFVFFQTKTLPDTVYIFRNMWMDLQVPALVEQLLYLSSNEISSSTLYYAMFFGLTVSGLVLSLYIDARIYPKDASNNAFGFFKHRFRWLLYWFMGISVLFAYFIQISGGGASFLYAGF